jgi:hypothetical protein
MTSGCDLAGVISAMGLFQCQYLAQLNDGTAHYMHPGSSGRNTHAIVAAPRTPNLIASPFFSATGGAKDVKTRFSSDIILQVCFSSASRWMVGNLQRCYSRGGNYFELVFRHGSYDGRFSTGPPISVADRPSPARCPYAGGISSSAQTNQVEKKSPCFDGGTKKDILHHKLDPSKQ